MRQFYLLFLSISLVFFGFLSKNDANDSTTVEYERKVLAKKKPNPPKKYRPLVLKPEKTDEKPIENSAKLWLNNALLAPSITAVKSVTGSAVLGGQLDYTIVVSNPGTDASNVVVTDQLVADLTLVAGSVKASPIAVDDAYDCIGNVGITVPATNGLLANDINPVNTSMQATAVNTAGTQGTVVANPDGSFTFNPTAGFSGTTTFGYTISNTYFARTATVTITVSAPIYFVNLAAGVSGTGTLQSPFKDISNVTGTGSNAIFIYSNVNPYSGTLTLGNNQKVIGQGSSASLIAILGITVPTFSNSLPIVGGTKPNLTSSGNTITLAQNNTLRGFDMGNSTKDIVGSSFGTLTASDMALNGNGQALDLSNGILAATFTSISSTNSADGGIILLTVGGTLGSSDGTTITNPTGVGIGVYTASSVTANFGNTNITGNGATGLLTTGSTQNTSALIFGSLNITPDAGKDAINAFQKGSITCTSGTITTTSMNTGSVPAVFITGANSSNKLTLNMVLDSYSSTGAGSQIGLGIWDTSGSFTINGTGTTAGSGGTISTFTHKGADLQRASNITLKNMNFVSANSSNDGTPSVTDNSNANGAIHAANVTGLALDKLIFTGTIVHNAINLYKVTTFSLANSTITDPGSGTGTLPSVEGGIHAIDLGGTCSITNTTIASPSSRCVLITQLANSTPLTLNISGSTFKDSFDGGVQGNDNLEINCNNSTVSTLNITNCNFLRSKTLQLQGLCNNSSQLTVNVQGSTFDNGSNASGGIELSSNNTATLNFNILNNTLIKASGQAGVYIGAKVNSTSQGRINGNTDIRTVGACCSAIYVDQDGNANMTVEILNNALTINNAGNFDNVIYLRNANGTTNSSSQNKLDASISGNTMNMTGTQAFAAIWSSAGTGTATEYNKTCVKINNNTLSGFINNLNYGHFADEAGTNSQLSLERITGGGTTAETIWNNNSNTPIHGSSAVVLPSGNNIILAPAACATPSNSNPPTAMAMQDMLSMQLEETPVQSVIADKETVLNESIEEFEPDVVKKEEKVTINENKEGKSTSNARLLSPQSGETVTVNGTGSGFKLPAGKSTTITFSATISNSPSTCAITNTASVSGSNFSTVNSNTTTSNIVIPPPTAVTPNSATSICTGTPVNLSATCASGTVNWYALANPTTLLGNSASGANFSQSPIGNTTYQAACLVGGCESTRVNSALITVNPNNTISLTSAVGTNAQTKCINTPITNITYATTGATGATFSGLPSGVTGTWASNIVTISGSPNTTTGSPFNYTVTLTGGCGTITATGTITVLPVNTVSLTSDVGTNAQALCVNTPITNITYATTGATGATFSGLPAGVTGAWAGNVVTISGSPTTATGSPFNYTVTLTGGCGTVTATGTITVSPTNTVSLTSAVGTNAQSKCINTAITNITYATTGATGATFSGLPTGVTGVWVGNVVTISGTPTTATGSPFNYTVTLTGGCGITTANGTITVNSTPAPTSPTATPSNFTVSGTTTLTASGCSSPSTISWYDSSNPLVALPNNTPTISSNKTFFAKCTGTNTCVSDPSANVNVTYNPCTPLGSSPGNVGINWTGLISTDWNNPCNWTPAWVPDATNSAVVIDLKTNQPTISGTVPSVKLIYVNSGATLTVASGGTLNASSTTAVLTLQGGNLINDGTINLSGGGSSTGLAIGATASITNRGTITTNNLFGASLQFGNLTFTNESTGIFNGDFKANNNILTLTNSGTINYAGGTYALSLGSAGSSVINSGTISVTAGSGISNPSGSTITNNACGKILVTASGYENGGTTINAGLIQMPNLYNFTNTGTFTNNGVVKANTVSSITNNKMVITNACPIFTLGGSNNYTVSGIFTDAGATNSAGTYTSVGNKFTANNTIPSGSQTLYAQVTDGTCTFVVPFDFDNKKPTAVSVNNTNVCLGTSVTLSGTCPSGTTLTWYTTATGGSNIGTGTNLSNSPTVSTTYYAACEATNCVSGRVGTNAISVVSPPVVSLFSQTDVSCNGGNNGTATVTASSGTAPYTYSWAPSGGTAATATGLSAGTYTVTVTDANSCQKSSTVIITQPSVLVASISGQTNVLCNGASTGSATVTASGGSPSYSYSWAPSGGTLATASGLAAGTYTVTVTDANSCQKTATVNITQPAAFIASITAQTNVLCDGASTGSATVTASSGTAPYTYSWAPSGGTAATATGLTAGTYTVTVTDGNSCQQTATVNITQPTALVASISAQTNVTCNGASTGSATVTASGGNPNYTYSWAPSGGTAATATGLAAGTYTVTVTDANSCQKTETVSITQPAALVASISAQTNVLCNGASTGSATVAASGGTPSYTYAWAPSGGTAATATGLAAGTYTVTVTDANNCQQTATVSITQPTALVASISAQTNVLCNGASTGSATVTASGGNPFFTNSTAPLGGTATTATNVSPSYTYSWAPSGGSAATATGLAAGTYTVTVTDANSCQQTATVNITQPTALVASISAQTNVACNGASTGSATVTATGGNPNYTYSWAPSGGTAAIATGLAAGTYTVTVTDANSCQKTATVTITQPTAIVASISAQTNVGCNGTNTGSATVTASGGTPSYTYAWAPAGGTAATATGLTAGTYTVTVTDANSCQQTATVNITQPAALVASISAQTNIICNGASTGSATVTASGGMASYTYAWAPSGGTAATATGLAAGTYTVTVTDANSCQKTATVNITQPTALVVSISAQTNVLCNGASTGSATVAASNGTAPYSYSWVPLGGTTATATGLAVGTYTVTVTDANTCQQTATVNITQPTSLVASISAQTNVLCNGASTGSATVTASGGNPNYTYSWAPSGGTAATATGLAAGTYTVTVTDANACQQTATVNITQPTALVASISAQTNVLCNGANTGSATVTASGGTPSYIYSWAPSGGTAATATGLDAGTYTVTVTDANSCQQTATVNITQPTALVASISAQTNVLCTGASTGLATVTASGGTPSYSYSWAPSGGTAATATGLASGTYTVTVTDANSCQKTATVNITQPTALVAAITAQTNTTCDGPSMGSATVTASGGSPSYTYSWAPSGGTSAVATGLAAGTYTVTVTDANGCSATVSTVVTFSNNLQITQHPQNVSICQGNNATFTVQANLPGVIYQWEVNTGSGFIPVVASAVYSGQNSATLSLAFPTLAYNNYKYRCIITLNSCNATSNEATLSLAGSAEALNIVNVSPISGVYSQTAVAYTIALNKIEPNANVLFKSGNAIELLPGFETRAGAVFATKIESPCGLNTTNNSIFDNLPKEIRK